MTGRPLMDRFQPRAAHPRGRPPVGSTMRFSGAARMTDFDPLPSPAAGRERPGGLAKVAEVLAPAQPAAGQADSVRKTPSRPNSPESLPIVSDWAAAA